MDAVIFDMDGVLVDSEPVWESVRREYVAAHGGRWLQDTQDRLMGMSTPEWAAYLAGELGVRRPAEAIADEVVDLMGERYRQGPPLLDGAVAAVHRLAARWPLGLASSSPPRLIDLVLRLAGLEREFGVRVSTEDVGHGKPAPDVYLEAARRLGKPPVSCAAVEDSSNGVRSAAAAGLRVIAVPAERYPLAADARAAACLVLDSLAGLTVEAVEECGAPR